MGQVFDSNCSCSKKKKERRYTRRVHVKFRTNVKNVRFRYFKMFYTIIIDYNYYYYYFVCLMLSSAHIMIENFQSFGNTFPLSFFAELMLFSFHSAV